MRKTIAALALSGLILPFGAMAGPGHADHMDRLAERLELTPEQKLQVESILTEQKEKRKALREETRARLSEILSPEQMERFDKKRGCHGKRHWKEHHTSQQAM